MSRGSGIEIIGGNAIGEKAAMLIEHAPLVVDAGLEIPKTTIIAEEVLKPFKERPLETSGKTEIPSHIGRIATYVAGAYAGDSILAVRSSAEGDARGTGIYESVFTANTQDAVLTGISRVLASFRTQEAQDFRRQTGSGEEFGIMIQPLIGQYLDAKQRLFGPVFSGIGYSKTNDDFYGMIKIVAGLGGGVNRQGAEQITYPYLSNAEELAKMYLGRSGEGNISFHDYIRVIREEQKSRDAQREITDFRDLAQIQREDGLYGVNGLALGDSSNGIYTPEMHRLSLGDGIKPPYENLWPQIDSVLLESMKAFRPEQILDAMQEMEKIAGHPLYIEWALTFEQDRLRPMILQIAPKELSPRSKIEAEIPEDPVVVARNIKGHGIINSDKIIYCPTLEAIDTLVKFNRDLANEGYILIYPAHLTSGNRYGSLRYENFSNASVIIETHSNIHGLSSMTDHIGGAMDKTGKFYGEFDHFGSPDTYFRLRRLLPAGEDFADPDNPEHDAIQVLPGKFEVIADESMDRLYIGSN